MVWSPNLLDVDYVKYQRMWVYPNFKTTPIVMIFHMRCPVWLNLYWVCQSSRGIEQNRGRKGRGGSGHRLELTGSPLHAHLMHNIHGAKM